MIADDLIHGGTAAVGHPTTVRAKNENEDGRRSAMAARAVRGQTPRRSATRVMASPLPRESPMNLEYLLVMFNGHRTVMADGTPIGVTNHVLMLPPGGYDITLDGAATTPADKQIDLLGTSIVRPMTVVFS
jgi:hypothetical protein